MGPLSTITEQQGPIISDFVECANNPGLSFGDAGSFDTGSVRDSTIWYARGLYWQLYTGAASPVSPYNPTIGIASSTDGCNWTKAGQIILPNAAVSECSGAVFSPGAHYVPETDVLYVYPSCASRGEYWYCGPIYVAQMHARTGADWTKASSFVWDNGGVPILRANQPWEGTQGVYGAEVYLVNGTFYMFYSSNQRGAVYQVGVASASFPGGPWTKSDTNPITSSTTYFEEPTVAQTQAGDLIMFGDNVGLALHGINVAKWNGNTITSAANWEQQSMFQFPDTATWSLNEIGSQSVVQSPDGRWLMCYNGRSSESLTDARTIGCAWFDLDSGN